jgi:hypothetical protein
VYERPTLLRFASQPVCVLIPVTFENLLFFFGRHFSPPRPDFCICRVLRSGQNVPVIAFCCFNLKPQFFQCSLCQFQYGELNARAFVPPSFDTILVEYVHHGRKLVLGKISPNDSLYIIRGHSGCRLLIHLL